MQWYLLKKEFYQQPEGEDKEVPDQSALFESLGPFQDSIMFELDGRVSNPREDGMMANLKVLVAAPADQQVSTAFRISKPGPRRCAGRLTLAGHVAVWIGARVR